MRLLVVLVSMTNGEEKHYEACPSHKPSTLTRDCGLLPSEPLTQSSCPISFRAPSSARGILVSSAAKVYIVPTEASLPYCEVVGQSHGIILARLKSAQRAYREVYETRIQVLRRRVREPVDRRFIVREVVEYIMPAMTLPAAGISSLELPQLSDAVIFATDTVFTASILRFEPRVVHLVENIAYFDIEAEGLENGIDCHVGTLKDSRERLAPLHGVVGISMAAEHAEVSTCCEHEYGVSCAAIWQCYTHLWA